MTIELHDSVRCRIEVAGFASPSDCFRDGSIWHFSMVWIDIVMSLTTVDS